MHKKTHKVAEFVHQQGACITDVHKDMLELINIRKQIDKFLDDFTGFFTR